MTIHITKLAEPQIDEAARLLARAFFEYPVWTWMVPDAARRRHVMPWFMRNSLRYGVVMGETYAAGDPIAGVAMWEPPGRLDADLDDGRSAWDELPAIMGAATMARFDALIETQRPVRDRVSDGKPVWYLPWIGVEPGAQRSGVGAGLLRDMFARADAHGIPCMLETELEANVPYYERHGFTVAESGVLPLAGPRFWTMRREPGG